MPHDLTGHNSYFLNMCHLASLGFEVVPGAYGVIKDGVFLAAFEYRFDPAKGIHIKRADGIAGFIPFGPEFLSRMMDFLEAGRQV